MRQVAGIVARLELETDGQVGRRDRWPSCGYDPPARLGKETGGQAGIGDSWPGGDMRKVAWLGYSI